MDRRAFLAVGATALLAGCDANGDQTDTPANSTPEPDNTETPGGGDTTPDDGGGTITPGGDFDATVTFQSCTEFTVDAEEYTTVFAVVGGGENSEWDEGYSGSESFEASGPINTVVVYSEGGSYEAPNPDAAECREE